MRGTQWCASAQRIMRVCLLRGPCGGGAGLGPRDPLPDQCARQAQRRVPRHAVRRGDPLQREHRLPVPHEGVPSQHGRAGGVACSLGRWASASRQAAAVGAPTRTLRCPATRVAAALRSVPGACHGCTHSGWSRLPVCGSCACAAAQMACKKELELFCKDVPHGEARAIRCLEVGAARSRTGHPPEAVHAWDGLPSCPIQATAALLSGVGSEGDPSSAALDEYAGARSTPQSPPPPPGRHVSPQDSKDKADFGKECRKEVSEYEKEAASDYRLNYRLAKNCEAQLRGLRRSCGTARKTGLRARYSLAALQRSCPSRDEGVPGCRSTGKSEIEALCKTACADMSLVSLAGRLRQGAAPGRPQALGSARMCQRGTREGVSGVLGSCGARSLAAWRGTGVHAARALPFVGRAAAATCCAASRSARARSRAARASRRCSTSKRQVAASPCSSRMP